MIEVPFFCATSSKSQLDCRADTRQIIAEYKNQPRRNSIERLLEVISALGLEELHTRFL